MLFTSRTVGSEPEFDVAISFLAKDQDIRGALDAILSGGVEGFLFPAGARAPHEDQRIGMKGLCAASQRRVWCARRSGAAVT